MAPKRGLEGPSDNHAANEDRSHTGCKPNGRHRRDDPNYGNHAHCGYHWRHDHAYSDRHRCPTHLDRRSSRSDPYGHDHRCQRWSSKRRLYVCRALRVPFPSRREPW